MPVQYGILVVSLDFELYWGVRDKKSLEEYKEKLLGVRSIVPALLELFEEYDIHATWATSGFLFFESYNELMNSLPDKKPRYENPALSPYGYLTRIGGNEREDPFHYAPSLIQMIASYSHQEIASHTFSHYYCLERGQDVETFEADLSAALDIAEKHNITIDTLVFPRNQCNKDYLALCRKMGIKAYRGNESSWLYRATREGDISPFRRALRVLDAYFSLSGHNAYSTEEVASSSPYNIASSRFLRPHIPALRFLEPIRLRRITSDISHAAKKRRVYHLWWHPHNFGTNQNENLAFLRKILKYFDIMRKLYGMESLNMRELTNRIKADQESISPNKKPDS